MREYQKRYSDIQRANLNLKVQNAELESRISSILVDGKVSTRLISQFIETGRQIDDLKTQLNNKQYELDESKEMNIELGEQNNQLKVTIEEMKTQITNLQTSIILQDQDSSYLSDFAKQLNDIKLENSKLKQEISSYEAINAEQIVTILNLQSQLNDINNNGKLSDSEIERMRNQNIESQKEIFELKKEITQLKAKLDDQKVLNLHQEDTIKNLNHAQHVNGQWTVELSKIIKDNATKFNRNINGFIESINEKLDILQDEMQIYEDNTNLKITKSLDRSFKEHSITIENHNDAIEKLLNLIQETTGLNSNQMPEAHEIVNDSAALEMFAGRLKTFVQLDKSRQQNEISQIKAQTQSSLKDPRRNQNVSPQVVSLIKNLTNSLNNLSDTIHADHQVLTEALDMKRYESAQ